MSEFCIDARPLRACWCICLLVKSTSRGLCRRVLIMLQKYLPASSGALPEFVGVLLFLCVVGGVLYGWMQSQQCWQLR